MCTISETKLTTTIIVTLSLSMRKPISRSSVPTVAQRYSDHSNGSTPFIAMPWNIHAESRNEAATPSMVIQCAPARPTWRPNRPATMAPNSGASTITRTAVCIGGAQPFIAFRSTTFIVRRLRNTTTSMARPMADSAAATVSMKKTKT